MLVKQCMGKLITFAFTNCNGTVNAIEIAENVSSGSKQLSMIVQDTVTLILAMVILKSISSSV
jgi:hypothetical protein